MLVAHGWNADVGALLGPEGTDPSLLARFGPGGGDVRFSLGGACRLHTVVWVGGCFRVLFENYTVDASIFVVKFLRAHGGCLGIRSR